MKLKATMKTRLEEVPPRLEQLFGLSVANCQGLPARTETGVSLHQFQWLVPEIFVLRDSVLEARTARQVCRLVVSLRDHQRSGCAPWTLRLLSTAPEPISAP